MPAVIFTSAYDQYAIRAFELMPVSSGEYVLVLKKLERTVLLPPPGRPATNC
jgi:hypothetical protein